MQLAAYYFPNYHPTDPRNQKLFNKPWSEWELIKAATPRFPSHQQPRVPLWGYTDESDPHVMAQKIDAAADHSIGAFIFDYYYYNDGPFLERALEQGFLKAKNNHRLKFALMWANHDWEAIFPASPGGNYKLLHPGQITPATWQKMTDYIIHHYFKHPSYWHVEGKPYFSIYDLGKFVASFGSLENTRKAMADFQQKAIAAGLPGINLNAIVWGNPILPGEKSPANPNDLAQQLHFDSISSYVWLHHVGLPNFPTNDFVTWQKAYFDHWATAAKSPIPYYPNVSVGWDSTPRTHQSLPWQNCHYPYTPIITNNTPQNFQSTLQPEKEKLQTLPPNRQILTINSWNEWTEGSYLEPDTTHGLKYLEAIKSTFPQKPR